MLEWQCWDWLTTAPCSEDVTSGESRSAQYSSLLVWLNVAPLLLLLLVGTSFCGIKYFSCMFFCQTSSDSCLFVISQCSAFFYLRGVNEWHTSRSRQMNSDRLILNKYNHVFVYSYSFGFMAPSVTLLSLSQHSCLRPFSATASEFQPFQLFTSYIFQLKLKIIELIFVHIFPT